MRKSESSSSKASSESRPRSSAAFSTPNCRIEVDLYLYHDRMVTVWQSIPLPFVSETILFQKIDGNSGWLIVETCVAGLLDSKSAIHCRLHDGATVADLSACLKSFVQIGPMPEK